MKFISKLEYFQENDTMSSYSVLKKASRLKHLQKEWSKDNFGCDTYSSWEEIV